MGGREFDRSLVEYYSKELAEKGSDLKANKRAHFRLLSQMHKTKEILSANKEIGFSIDDLLEGVDFKRTALTPRESLYYI